MELTPTPPFGEAGGAPTPPPMPPILTEQEAQDAFIESVKKKLAIRTPLDTTFWRPYARVHPEIKASDTNQTNLVFVAGAEGTGHHFITAVMMRLKELMPMTLVQEQMFQALWWKPEERDPAVFWSALESFEEWVQVVSRCCDAKVAEEHRNGEEFEWVLQRWLHYSFIPTYKSLLKDKARGIASKTL